MMLSPADPYAPGVFTLLEAHNDGYNERTTGPFCGSPS
jgi:hypothetical protein